MFLGVHHCIVPSQPYTDIPHIQTTSIIFSRQLLYMCYCPLRTMLSLPSSTLLTSTFCFQPTFAYARAKPPEPCHRLICNRHIYHVCTSRSQAQLCGSTTSERSHGMRWKPRQWRLLMETRCHLETIRVPLAETVFK